MPGKKIKKVISRRRPSEANKLQENPSTLDSIRQTAQESDTNSMSQSRSNQHSEFGTLSQSQPREHSDSANISSSLMIPEDDEGIISTGTLSQQTDISEGSAVLQVNQETSSRLREIPENISTPNLQAGTSGMRRGERSNSVADINAIAIPGENESRNRGAVENYPVYYPNQLNESSHQPAPNNQPMQRSNNTIKSFLVGAAVLVVVAGLVYYFIRNSRGDAETSVESTTISTENIKTSVDVFKVDGEDI